jgi:hypothetical protein
MDDQVCLKKTTSRPTGRGVVHSNVRDLSPAICVRSKAGSFGHYSGARLYHATGRNPVYFRVAAGSWTGTCGEVLITRVLPSE